MDSIDYKTVGEAILALLLIGKLIYDYATSAGRASRGDVAALRKQVEDYWAANQEMRVSIATLQGQLVASDATNVAIRLAAATASVEAVTARIAAAAATTTAAAVAADAANKIIEREMAHSAKQDTELALLNTRVDALLVIIEAMKAERETLTEIIAELRRDIDSSKGDV